MPRKSVEKPEIIFDDGAFAPYAPLYVGVSELIAKEAPVHGLSNGRPIKITNAFPGYFAWSAIKRERRDWWGIIKLKSVHLFESCALPSAEDNIDSLRRQKRLWKKSVKQNHVFLYDGCIRPEAIARVVIYDPKSNPFITNLASTFKKKLSKLDLLRCQLLCRWFMAERIELTDWFPEAADEFDIDPKIKIETMDGLFNQSGLELFYSDEGKK